MSETNETRIDVVAGLIFKGKDLLVCQRRSDGLFPLKWEFPGGKIERGETDRKALRRELREELGIRINQSEPIFTHEHRYPGGMRVTLRFFRVNHYDGELQNLVFQKISWVRICDLPAIDFLEGDLPLVQKLSIPGNNWLP